MDWRYIAGFIDGEGTIFIKNNRFRINVTQTNKEVLQAIKNFANCGNVAEITKRKAHWKDCWVYYISNKKDIFEFLTKICPYLIVKKDDAQYAIDYLRNDLPRMLKQKQELLERKKTAESLRKAGLSYREIGKKLGHDWGYIRRLILK